MIRPQLEIDFVKGADIEGVLNMIRRWTRMVKSVTYDETVHYQTLLSYVKERIENGLQIPFYIFAVSTGRVAKVVPPPKPKQPKQEKPK